MEDEELQEQIAGDEQFLQYVQQNPQLMEQIQNNPEMLRQLYQDYTGQQVILDKKLAQADALRTGTPEGIYTPSGYVAANPLEHLASVGSEGLAAYGQKQAMDKMEALSQDKTEGVQGVVSGMGGQAPQNPQAAQAEALRKMQMMRQNQTAQQFT